MNEQQPTQKHNVSLIVLFFAFFAGFGGVFTYRYIRTPKHEALTQVTTNSNQPIPQPTFALEPPAQALFGTLTVLKGHAELFARNTDVYAEASTDAQILNGESVATKEDSSASVIIENIITATMDESAEVVFANVFANNMVLQQKAGKVTYQLVDGVNPVAVRALHALISIRSGETIITIIDTDISVTVKNGSVKLAIVDSDNDTNVWELKEGQRADVDDTAREITVLKAR